MGRMPWTAYFKRTVTNPAGFLKPRRGDETAVSSARRFGQPVVRTHPHLLDDGELTPGISAHEYAERRRRLGRRISSTPLFRSDLDHLVVVPGAGFKYMTKDIPYAFKQNTDFLYLTGFLEPDSCLVMFKDRASPDFETILFVPEVNETGLVWHGPSTGRKATREIFGADQALLNTDFKNYVDEFKSRPRKSFCVWYDFSNSKPVHPEVDAVVNDLVLRDHHHTCHSHRSHIDELKVVKSSAEVALMRETCSVAAKSLKDTIAFSRPGLRESVLESRMSLTSTMLGSDRLSFPPVVAAGNNANVIHYIRNDQRIQEGDLVLMDTGCEVHGYSSDITRTWPATGKFSPAQRVLYDVVHITQSLVMDQLRPGLTLDQAHWLMLATLGQKLSEAGVLKPEVPSGREKWSAIGRQSCPHHASHYLGMDVHDSSSISRSRPLEPNMVVTNEPGLYFPPYLKIADLIRPDFVGLGIRVEDDVLITSGDPVILTHECPSDPRLLEALVGSAVLR